MTADGRTTKTLPLPLLVLIPATALPTQIPDVGVHVLFPQYVQHLGCPDRVRTVVEGDRDGAGVR